MKFGDYLFLILLLLLGFGLVTVASLAEFRDASAAWGLGILGSFYVAMSILLFDRHRGDRS